MNVPYFHFNFIVKYTPQFDLIEKLFIFNFLFMSRFVRNLGENAGKISGQFSEEGV